MEHDSPSSSVRSAFTKRFRVSTAIKWLVALVILAALVEGIFLGPITPGFRKARESQAMQSSRSIALAMFQFANDNGGKYPIGRSSTEVFQQLIDGNYVADPAIFYFEMQGKRKATSKKLEPENVCYDVTIPVNSSSPDGLPFVFLTGYQVEYKAGGSAIPLSESSAPFGRDGLAVSYKSNRAWFKTGFSGQENRVIQVFVPADFKAGSAHFQQLTPEGPLPPAP